MNRTSFENFEVFFKKATGNNPYPYQKKLAESSIPSVINVPTGAGKTESAILGVWLWHRLHDDGTPRRLIYCLPQRVLVEQTEQRVKGWLKNLGLEEEIGVALLLGGDQDKEFDKYPAKDCIIIGTQDVLISGALNRRYGTNPFSWPITFGLLNNDCLWILDEIQIMENALPTSIQLDAFRKSFKTFGPCHTVWMSATLQPEWLKTVNSTSDKLDVHGITKQDKEHSELKKRNNAIKILRKAKIVLKKKYEKTDVQYLHSLHIQGTVTIIMTNTVKRAQDLYDLFKNIQVDCKLIHSRFRTADRTKLNKWINDLDENQDKIIISTQVLEAGVDISAHTMITENAPWSNMVQRFGRCNRKGELRNAEVYWIDIILDEKNSVPYDMEDLESSRKKLIDLTDKSIAPSVLPPYKESRSFDAVLRKKDLIDLFDTTSDLSGNYVDASRFVRTIKRQLDVDVFWRTDDKESKPVRDELCSVSIGNLKDFVNKRKVACKVWNYVEGEWEKVYAENLFPGQTVMLDGKNGGYSEVYGWNVSITDSVDPLKNQNETSDSNDTDKQSESTSPITLKDHTTHVLHETDKILKCIGFLDEDIKEAIMTAVKYHDIGKAHQVFQDTIIRGIRITDKVKPEIWAKSQKMNRHAIPGFRHEVASALAYIEHTREDKSRLRDLIAYLVASHHGKVRLSIRNASRKKHSRYNDDYLLGIKIDGDTLPEFTSDIISTKKTSLDISLARIGRRNNGSTPSWTEMAVELRDKYGPFRLAYLEMLVRAADGLASKKEKVSKKRSSSHE